MNKVETGFPQDNSHCCHLEPPAPVARCSLELVETAFAFLRLGSPGKTAVAVVVVVAVGTSVVEGTSAVVAVVVVERDHYSQLDRIEGMAFDRR